MEAAGIVSYGRMLYNNVNNGRFLCAGASVKMVRQIVDSASAESFGVDAGVLCKMCRNLTLGLSAQNVVAPRLKLDTAADQYPLSVTAGAGYRLLNDKLLLALDANKTANTDYQLHAGGEYTLFKMLSLRAGINETELDFGLGFKYKGYSLDYAFALNDASQANNLGASNRIGLDVKF